MSTTIATTKLLDVRSLTVSFTKNDTSSAPAVDNLSFDVNIGETVALVGESGCGKSTTALALMRLFSKQEARVDAQSLLLGDTDLLSLSEKQMCKLRGGDIAMIFQDPLSALNPVRTVGQQLTEALRLHQSLRGRQARQEALQLLRQVHISEPERRLDDYPHRLSGGMRQRVLIAMALAGKPRLLIADEPTTALDVTIQAQILELLRELQRANGMAILLITHDLGVVANMANRVVVMYAGNAVETRAAHALFNQPSHPYTNKLLQARPIRGPRIRLAEIPGAVPTPGSVAHGCRYAARCEYVRDACLTILPDLTPVSDGEVRCIAWHDIDHPHATLSPPHQERRHVA